MVKIKIIMRSLKKEDDEKLEKAATAVPEAPTDFKIIMPSFKKEDDRLEKAASVPQLPTKPRTDRKLQNTGSQSIMKKSVVRKRKLNPEALREKIASIKYSRDYSFLFSDDEPVVHKSPPVKHLTESRPKQPKPTPTPTPSKHSTQVSSRKVASDSKFKHSYLQNKFIARRR